MNRQKMTTRGIGLLVLLETMNLGHPAEQDFGKEELELGREFDQAYPNGSEEERSKYVLDGLRSLALRE